MKLELDLLENGLDFILNSIRIINENTEATATKYAVLNLSSGVELIFKERLSKEHWSLLFEDINKANRKHLESGDFRSVNSLTSKIRLEEICSIDFKKIDTKDHLNSLRLIRNKIEHFEFKENIESLKGLFANVLFAIIKFIESELDETKFTVKHKELFNLIKEHSIKFEKYAELKLKDIEPEIKKWAYVFDCPHCLNESMAITDEGLKCFFCGEFPNPEQLAKEWYCSSIQPMECLECNLKSIIKKGNVHLCLNCAEEYTDLRQCCNCGRSYIPADETEEYYCTECLQDQHYEDESYRHS